MIPDFDQMRSDPVMKLARRRRLRLSLQTAPLSRDPTEPLGSGSCPDRRSKGGSVRSLEREEEEEDEGVGRRRRIPGDPSKELRDKSDFVALTDPSKKTRLPVVHPQPLPLDPASSAQPAVLFPELNVPLFTITHRHRPHADMLQMHWRSAARCCKLLAPHFPLPIWFSDESQQ